MQIRIVQWVVRCWGKNESILVNLMERLKLGYCQLPESLIQRMPHVRWLEHYVKLFVSLPSLNKL
jgi:hypothetical protein